MLAKHFAPAMTHGGSFSPDGKQILTSSDDGTARIWDVRTGRQLVALSEPTGEAINDA
jgi:WD40 repeat protein